MKKLLVFFLSLLVSLNSFAPSFIAETAMSIFPCPDITIIGTFSFFLICLRICKPSYFELSSHTSRIIRLYELLFIKSKASRENVNQEYKKLNLKYPEVEYFVDFINSSERGVTR